MASDVDNALRQIIPQIVDARLPIATILKHLHANPNHGRAAQKRLYEDALSTTVYGTVMQTESLHYNGKQIRVDFADVRPLIRFLCQECPLLGSFLQKSLGSKAEVMLYMDESKPGNQLRPDSGRAFEAIYWIPMGFPNFLLRRARAWFTCAYVSVADMKEAGCPSSSVLKFVI